MLLPKGNKTVCLKMDKIVLVMTKLKDKGYGL